MGYALSGFSETRTERLDAPLDSGRVKQRDSFGTGTLSYLETHDVIRTANKIFGFGGWGHEIVELRPIEPCTVTNRDNKTGLQVGYICIVKLTVTGGVPVSGIGYGDAVEYRQSAPITAHELAAKEAESDALKRALKNYGDQFGLALYDKAAAQNGHLTNGSPGGEQAVERQATTRPAAAANLDTFTFPFGKYKGRTIAQVAEENPGYLDWFIGKTDKEEIKDLIREHQNLAELDEVGAVFAGAGTDDDIPFDRSIDGIGG